MFENGTRVVLYISDVSRRQGEFYSTQRRRDAEIFLFIVWLEEEEVEKAQWARGLANFGATLMVEMFGNGTVVVWLRRSPREDWSVNLLRLRCRWFWSVGVTNDWPTIGCSGRIHSHQLYCTARVSGNIGDSYRLEFSYQAFDGRCFSLQSFRQISNAKQTNWT